MTQSDSPGTSDRNLLFGVLALQLKFITSDALLDAMTAWASDKQRSLGAVLLQQRTLSPSRRQLLEALVIEQLRAHGDDPQRSLASLAPPDPIQQALRAIADADVQASMSYIGTALPAGPGRHNRSTEVPQDATLAGTPAAPNVPPLPKREGKSIPSPAAESTHASGRDGASPGAFDEEATISGNPGAALLRLRPNQGRFHIVRSHAKGGLGEVFIARDSELNREVALKEIKRYHANDDVSQGRFLLEAEITGRLEHPGIVPVYSLGRHDDGRPFYVMRFIRGETLQAAIEQFHKADVPGRDARERSLTFRQLLRRFMDVCNTVAYAHSRGVLHRDLKPGNVMLGKYGETLIIDWGLAKPVGRSEMVAVTGEYTLKPATDSSVVQTQDGVALGTPAYMSPEQAAGQLDEIAATSDIYSLGATLYALLTGVPAFSKGALATVLAQVQKGEFKPPRKLKPATPRPLDAIVLKAMALKPEDRYATAEALAQDVERWLAEEAVSAYREPLGARLRRWGRRHRVLVGSASATLLAALVCLGVATVLLTAANERERQAKADAENNYQTAVAAQDHERQAREREQGAKLRAEASAALAHEAVDKYLTSVAEDERLQEADLVALRKQLLETALPFFEQFVQQEGDDPKWQAKCGKVYEQLATVHGQIGDTDGALKYYEQMRATCQRLLDREPGTAAHRTALARGHASAAFQLWRARRYPEAEKHIQAALALSEKLAADFPQEPSYRAAVASNQLILGLVLEGLDRKADAEAIDRAALATFVALAGEQPQHAEYRRKQATLHNNLAIILRATGRVEDAEQAYRTALDLYAHLVESEPKVRIHRSLMALTCQNLGNLLRDAERMEAAETAYREAIAIRDKLAAANPTLVEYRRDLAGSYTSLAALRSTMGNKRGAETAYREAMAIKAKLAAQFPADWTQRIDLARLYFDLGLLLRNLSRKDEALEAYQAALHARQEIVRDFPDQPAGRTDLAQVYSSLGYYLRDLGKKDEAASAFREAAQVRAKLAVEFPDDPKYTKSIVDSQVDLAHLLAGSDRKQDAEAVYREALPAAQKLADDYPKDESYREKLALIHNNLGVLLGGASPNPEATVAYRASLTVREQLEADFPKNPNHRYEAARTSTNLASVLKAAGNLAEAEQFYRGALTRHERLAADYPDKPAYRNDLAYDHVKLAILLKEMNRRPEAEIAYRAAVTVREKLVADFPKVAQYHVDLAACQSNVAELLRAADRTKDAEAVYREIVVVKHKLVAAYPASATYRDSLATTYLSLAGLLSSQGQTRDAEDAYRKAMSHQERLAAESPTVASYRGRWANAQFQLGLLLGRAGRQSEAEGLFVQAQTIQQKLAEEFPQTAGYRNSLALTMHSLASLYKSTHRRSEAETAFRNTIALQVKLAEEFPDEVGFRQELLRTRYNVSHLLRDTGRLKEAESTLRDVLSARDQLAADNPKNALNRQSIGHTRYGLALILKDTGRTREAETEAKAALQLRQQLVDELPRDPARRAGLGESYLHLGKLYREIGRFQEAATAMRSARDVFGKLCADFPYRTDYLSEQGQVQDSLAVLLRQLGKPRDAEPLARAAVDGQQRLVAQCPTEPSHRQQLALFHEHRGHLFLYGLKDPGRAEAEFRQALVITEQLVTGNPADEEYPRHLAQRYNLLTTFLRNQGQAAQAAELRQKALAAFDHWAKERPQNAALAVQLAWLHRDLSYRLRDKKDKEPLTHALLWYDKVVAQLDRELIKQEVAAQAVARQQLRAALEGRAFVLSRLDNHPAALKDWERAITLEENDYLADRARLRRLTGLARSGKHSAAVTEAAVVAKKWVADKHVAYQLACVHAQAYLAASGEAKAKITGADGLRKQADQYAAQAVDWLTKAIPLGFSDAHHFERLQQELDLEPLRHLPEFVKLMKKLEADPK